MIVPFLRITAVEISFGEIDYRSREDRGVSVVVVKSGANFGDIKLSVAPLSEAAFNETGFILTEEKFNSEFLSESRAQCEILQCTSNVWRCATLY